MQSLLRLAFPPQCISCRGLVDQEFGLCGTCWRETPFILGLVCEQCGIPLPGDDAGGDATCDDCLHVARPWARGRAAVLYKGTGRKLVLALKHGDRLDLAWPLARWMAGAAAPLLSQNSVLVPVPAHPVRLLKRRYNQAAVLANAISGMVKRDALPDLLRRSRRTEIQDGKSHHQRFENLAQAIQPSRHAARKLAGRPVILVDDVMTSGATLAAAAEACYEAGAYQVDILALARVTKDA